MTHYQHDFTTTYTVDDEFIENIIDLAGYSISYWANSAVVSTEDKTYTVTEEDAHDGEGERSFILTHEDIFKACVKLADGTVKVNHTVSANIKGALFDPEDADLDSDDADCIIQTACFSDIIYG